MSIEEPAPNGQSLAFVEGLYEQYLEDPSSVDDDWVSYFQSLQTELGNGSVQLSPSFSPASIFNPPGGGNGRVSSSGKTDLEHMGELQHHVDLIIRNYRVRGHLMACSETLGAQTVELPELDPAYYGFTDDELDQKFAAKSIGSADMLTLREIITRMQNTYCRSIGVQFMHIDDLAVRDWIQNRIENTENRIEMNRDTQLRILTRLTDAVVFEEFIQKKYPGAKSFSLEGAESLIPLLDLAIEKAGSQDIDEIVFGMSHRGRLNVLANIMGKEPAQIFREYEDKDPELYMGGGDVKYHMGYHTEWPTATGKKVHLALCFNPSHLEFVNPVALGRMRGRQDRTGDVNHEKGMVVLIHGDAAFAGQGIVMETLNLSNLGGYRTGGTLHIIVNNQIGFTTNPYEHRSTTYCTDVAKMLQSPILHVDGEDPEAVAQAVEVAMDFRKTFKRDVVLDMFCYRKRGHNEGDEPSFTQPLMYKEIKSRKSVRDRYLSGTLKLGNITQEEADSIEVNRRDHLEEALTEARARPQVRPPSVLRTIWNNYQGGPDKHVPEVDSGVPVEKLKDLILSLTTLPDDFTPHPKLAKIFAGRRKMATDDVPLDWAMGEALAYATLAAEGSRVRLSGQDCERGTFSHRHAVVYDVETGKSFHPFHHISDDQGPVDIINSPLAETSVLGFEYGYSLAHPDGLTMWEAQFGDFSNVAQPIFDQFITSAEDKWRSLSGLTVLLPHAFEGMGPEHSSARLERFLGLAAEDNIQICIPTTPAQFFHLLRRQVVRPWRKPLIVMTPKSLLRHPRAISSLEELSEGRFRRILPDLHSEAKDIKRILLCCGKIYYELEEQREKQERHDVAILRVEQLYPLQPPDLEAALSPYESGTPTYWVQDEPENMGAWRRMKGKFGQQLLGRFPFTVACRPASASPATGSAHSHRLEQQMIMDLAFGNEETSWY